MRESSTLYQAVARYKNSKSVALYFRDKTIRFPEFINRVDKMASILHSLGIKKDTVVTLLAPNVPETIITLYALSKIGAIASILHPLLPSEVLYESIIETKATHFIVLDVLAIKYLDIIKRTKIKTYYISAVPDLNPIGRIGFHLMYKKELSSIDKTKYLYKMKSDDKVVLNEDGLKPSLYLRSGGTTGKSKTVIINDEAINFVTSQSKDILCHETEGFSMIGLMPIFHGFGLAMGIHAPLSNNAASALMISYDGNEIVRKIRQNKINVLLTIPYLTDKLLARKDFSGKKLRNLIATYIGADKPETRLFSEFNKRMEEASSINRLLEGYGLTETATVNFVNTLKENKIGSVGKPLKGVKVKIVDPEVSYEEDLKPNQTGEILISSPSLCLGYLNVEEDKQPFYYDSENNKWLKTGDIGYLDEEGFLFFINRAKDVYKIAGYNIFPADIEKLAGEVEGVKSCAAIYHKDDKHPYFTLYVESDVTDKEMLISKIQRYLKERLIKYSIPEKIVVSKSLPRTDIGKIDRKKLN